jgi:tight adherence protein C
MTVVLASVGGLVLLSRHRHAAAASLVVAVLAFFGAIPAVGLCAGGALFIGWRRARRLDRDRRDERRLDLLCVEVAALSVSAGLTFNDAAHNAAETVGGKVGPELSGALRRSSAGLDGEVGAPGVDAMLAEARRSAVSGAPLGRSLDVLISSMRSDRASDARERLARLPVKLLFPLALLILPGFVLMTVGPAVISGLSRIGL